MRPFIILITLIFALMLNVNAHQNATAFPISSSYKIVFHSRDTEPKRSIEIVSDRNRTESITVHFFNKPIKVSREELKGIEKIQLESMTFHYGSHKNGTRFCYIIAPFGSDIGASKADFKRIRFHFENGKYVKYTISRSRLDHRPETIKLNGKPIKAANKAQ